MNALSIASGIASIISALITLARLGGDIWRYKMRQDNKKRPRK